MKTNKIMDILLYVLVFVAVLPVIANTIAGLGGNITGATLAIVTLIPLVVVFGAIKYVQKHGIGR